MTTQPMHHSSTPLYATLSKRVAIATAVVLLGLVPTLALLLITKEFAATWATVAYIVGVTALLMGGIEVAVTVVIVMSLIVPVAIVAGGTPIAGAALMALMCLTVGRTSRFGLQRATLLVPVLLSWMLISPPFWGPQEVVNRTDATFLGWMTAIWFIGGIFPVIVLPFALRKVKMPVPKPHPRREAMPYTITITVLATAATYWVLSTPSQDAGAWLIATILVLAQVGDVGTLKRTLHRVIGTVLGLVIVVVLITRVQSLTLIYIIGIVFGIAAVAAKFSPRYWIYMALVTPAVICLTASASSQIKNLGVQRAEDTLIGAALVTLAACCTIGFAHLEKRRGHAPTEESPSLLNPAILTPEANET